jgi:predicted nuclease with TOPRIM domain
VEETQRLREQATKLETELSGLESQLSQMRKERESAKQAVFEDRLAIEAARVAKRNAELEIQRFIEMTARRAGTTLGSLQIAP